MVNENEQTRILLAQWQTCVGMANNVSQRRDFTNNLFVTVNLAITAAISVVWDLKSLFLMAAGIAVCALWIKMINHFRVLNKEKFVVINKLEDSLPSKPFSDEWDRLSHNDQYRDATSWEKFLPWVFIVLYAIAIIVILIIKFYCGGA